jgi:hypothetical protein
MYKTLERLVRKYVAWCGLTMLVALGEPPTAEAKGAGKKDPIVKIDNVRSRFDSDANPWVAFEATAARPIRSAWIVVKAKCKDGSKTKVDEANAMLDNVDGGETKELEEPFGQLTLPNGAEWCQFEFSFKSNVFQSAATPLRVFCWQNRSVVPDVKCPLPSEPQQSPTYRIVPPPPSADDDEPGRL